MRVTHAGLHLCRTGTFKMQDVFDMVYSLLVFVNIRVILYKTYVVLIFGKYNTLTLEFKINIAIHVPLHSNATNTHPLQSNESHSCIQCPCLHLPEGNYAVFSTLLMF